MHGLTPWEMAVVGIAIIAGAMCLLVIGMLAWTGYQDWRLTRQYGSKAVDDVQRMLDAELIDEPREDRK